MNVAAYVRVSTDEQADKGNSISEQQERLASYCKAMGWPAPTMFIDDGYSAKNLKRPAINELLDLVAKKQYQVVLSTKLDRICRNLLDLLTLINTFESFGCRYVSASESFDTSTAAGRMTLHLLGMFAEFERERISERVKDNMLSLARNTNKALAGPCFGYDIVDGNYAINEAEAEHVRFMFDESEQGRGSRHIAKLLNDKNVLTKRGKQWDSVNVKRLITNPTLMGVKIFNMRDETKGKRKIREKSQWIVKENSHPAIITPERFEAVQTILNARKPSRANSDNETYLLTGLIYCKHCGARMKGSTARLKKHTYYRYLCGSYSLGYGCKYHAVHRDDVEAQLIDAIRRISESSDSDIQEMVSTRFNGNEVKEIESQLLKIEKRMQKQIEAYEHDLISASDLKLARQRIEKEKEKLLEQLERLKNRTVDSEKIRNEFRQQLDDITGTDRLKAKKSMALLIDSVIVEAPNISIVWRV
jgi:site-specific DNA recombinase